MPDSSQNVNEYSQTEFNQVNEQLKQTPIAIVGMASVFPKADKLETYWDNILNKVDCITDVPKSHWDADTYYDPDPKAPDKTYCKRGGFIPDVELDLMEFGLPPNLLDVTDISQLLSLVVAKQALEDAGYDQSRQFDREKVGIILGAAGGGRMSLPHGSRLQYPVWEKVLKSSGLSDEDTQRIINKVKSAYVEWEENSFPGMLANIVAGRVANRLDLGGTNCTIDAACASSLAAFKMAMGELLSGQCDMMLTGGVDTDNTVFTYLCFSKTPALSKKQQTRPFDIDSDGMMLGEGLGMVVLKRLEDAERDGDKIYAVVRGIGSSSDGKFKSIYAPRSEGQVRALHRAYEIAGVDPKTISLIEAHGTGTMAGDPAEVSGLKSFFEQRGAKSQKIALGSVKSQIGHTKAAAGAASLIKVALALSHKVLPPTINVTKPSPRLGLEGSSLYINTENRPWIRAEGEPPRRAGVSSFGFGGTNFHVVLEEYQSENNRPYRLNRTPQPLLFWASTPEQLKVRCEEVLAQLQSESGDRHFFELVDAYRSPQIPLANARIGFIADSPAEAVNKLRTGISLLNSGPSESWEHPFGIYYRRCGANLDGKVVALFPGQGAQYLGMGRELALNFPALRQAYGKLDRWLKQDGLQPVSDVVFPIPVFEPEQAEAQRKLLQQTEYAQPAIAALTAGLYTILQDAGFKPDFAAGHSFGELSALWSAGVLSDDDYFFLVKARGQAMAAPSQPGFDAGAMLAVVGDINSLQSALKEFPQVSVANYNSNSQVVLAGPRLVIQRLEQQLSEQGLSPKPLPVSAAFHTPLVAHAQQPFAKAVDSVTFKAPQTAVYTNMTGDCYPSDPEEIKQYLKEHLSHSVQFRQEVENIYRAGGYCFVEVGPRSILTNLVKEILGDRPHIAVALNASRQKDSDRQMREAVVQLQVAGLALQNPDFYQVQPQPPRKKTKKGFSVYLNGGGYVSEKRRKVFEQALKDEHTVQLVKVQREEAVEARIPEENVSTSAHFVSTPSPVQHSANSPSNGAHKTNGNGLAFQPSNGNHHRNGAAFSPASGVEANSNAADNQPTATSAAPVMPASEPPAISKTRESVSSHQALSTHSMSRSMYQSASPAKQDTTVSSFDSPMSTQPMYNPSSKHQRALDFLEYSLAQFNQHQSAILNLHGQYLSNQMEYAKTFFHLMQHQNALLASESSSQQATDVRKAALASIERSMMQFHNHQQETLRVHEQSLLHQSEHSKSFLNVVQQQCHLLLEGEADTNLYELIETSETLDISVDAAQSTAAAPTSIPSKPDVQPSEPSVKSAPAAPSQPAAAEVAPPVVNAPTEQPQPSIAVANFAVQEFAERSTPAAPEAPQPPAQPVAQGDRAEQPAVNAPVQDTSIVASQPIQLNARPVEPAAVASSDSAELSAISQNLISIVSDKTGYPTEMLELDMDMEADLGIDSIKRVEILGALQEMFPNLPSPNPEEVGEIRTLQQVVESIQTLMGATAPALSPAQPEAVPNGAQPQAVVDTPNLPVPAASSSMSVAEVDDISQNLISIVSDKTGYPTEMLELDMDMEADLGIDSIKRVEILGALQEMFPNLPSPNPEEIGEIRTLQQVVESIQTLMGATAPALSPAQPEAVPNGASGNGAAPASQSAELQSMPQASSLPVPAGQSEVALVEANKISQTLISIVSDKTGYPTEMLELDMDMEADLGIDSIKRVEILGALQELFPDLPSPNPEEIGEIRTLQQVAEQLLLQKKKLQAQLA